MLPSCQTLVMVCDMSTKPKTLKTVVIAVRLTPEQKQELAKAAEREGFDVSVWLRSVGIKAARALTE